jgi:hypothetical protein
MSSPFHQLSLAVVIWPYSSHHQFQLKLHALTVTTAMGTLRHYVETGHLSDKKHTVQPPELLATSMPKEVSRHLDSQHIYYTRLNGKKEGARAEEYNKSTRQIQHKCHI